MSAPKKPKKPKLKQGDKTPPPVGPPPLTDTPTMHERPHSPAAAVPPEGEAKQPTHGRTSPPPLGPPPLEVTPTPKMPIRPHSPVAADPPEDETQPVASDYGSTGGIMPKGETGPEAAPRSSGGSKHQETQAAAREQRIRERAYQLWEMEGGTGDPEDHWHKAERELNDAK